MRVTTTMIYWMSTGRATNHVSTIGLTKSTG